MANKKRKRSRRTDPGESSSENPAKKSAPPKNVVVIRNPLSYDSLQTVLQYMNPNKRFQVSKCMPAIRSVEKRVPLRLDYLYFGEMSVTVNDTKYLLGVVRKCHKEGDTTVDIKYHNESGGAHFDLDRYGFYDKSMDALITPGDIVFQQPGPVGPPKTKKDYQRRLTELEERHRLDMNPRGRCLGWRIKDSSHERWLLRCLLKDKLPPYDSFIRLTITELKDDESDDWYSDDDEEAQRNRVIQQSPYNFKLYQALKNLTSNIFGNRSKPIQVNKLEFGGRNTVFRLPLGLKLQVKELSLHEEISRALTQLTPIIHESSFPLRCLEAECENGPDELRHPIIQNNLQKLIVIPIRWAKDCLCVHKNTHLDRKTSCGIHFQYAELIKLWINMQREVGSCITENYKEEADAMKVLKAVKTEGFELREQKEGMLLIPINEWSQIKMTVEEGG